MDQLQNMEQLQKAVELYELMAERCERNGFSPAQAKVYAEMADFTAKCADIDDATSAIKNSKYYLAPTEALVRDRIGAQIKAAEENEMPEVAEIYANKLKAIDADQGEMYTAGYETAALNIKAEYINTIQAFIEVYRTYLSYIMDRAETYITEMKMNLSKLKKPSSDFKTLAALPKFRSLIGLSDDAYAKFVDAVLAVQAGQSIATLVVPADCTDDAKAAWDEVKSAESEIKAYGKEVLSKITKANAKATAPTLEEYNAAVAAGKKAQYTFEKE